MVCLITLFSPQFQRQLMEEKQKAKRMQTGMIQVNENRPRSGRNARLDDATRPLVTGSSNKGSQPIMSQHGGYLLLHV